MPFAQAAPESDKTSKEVIFKGKKGRKQKKSQDPVAIMLPQRDQSDSEGELAGEELLSTGAIAIKKNTS